MSEATNNNRDIPSKWIGGAIRRTLSSDDEKHRNHRVELIAHRTLILALTFVIFATYRLSRRPFSIVKAVLEASGNCSGNDQEEESEVKSILGQNHSIQILNQNFTTHFDQIDSHSADSATRCGWYPFDGEHGKELLGSLDSTFLVVYAVGIFAAGYVAERVNVRHLLCGSLTLCGLVCIAQGLAKWFSIHSLWYFYLVQALNGIGQTGLPAVISVVGAWWGADKKGAIFGVWSWHTSVGNMAGSAVAGAFVQQDWALSFIVPGSVCLTIAVLIFFSLVIKPANVDLHLGGDTRSPVDQAEEGNHDLAQQIYDMQEKRVSICDTQAISILDALQIQGVIEFSLCLFFTKMVSYTFLYWLPVYLKETSHFSSQTSAYASIMFDIGGCLGSLAAGFAADWSGGCALTCITFLAASIPSLYCYSLFSATSMAANQALQLLAGACIIGPFSLIMATVSANLALTNTKGKSAMATVSAIINGTGTIGAAIGPAIAGIISEFGWQYVFYMVIGAMFAAILTLVRVGRRELRTILVRRRKRKDDSCQMSNSSKIAPK